MYVLTYIPATEINIRPTNYQGTILLRKVSFFSLGAMLLAFTGEILDIFR